MPGRHDDGRFIACDGIRRSVPRLPGWRPGCRAAFTELWWFHFCAFDEEDFHDFHDEFDQVLLKFCDSCEDLIGGKDEIDSASLA